jgi:hypothetical protein
VPHLFALRDFDDNYFVLAAAVAFVTAIGGVITAHFFIFFLIAAVIAPTTVAAVIAPTTVSFRFTTGVALRATVVFIPGRADLKI